MTRPSIDRSRGHVVIVGISKEKCEEYATRLFADKPKGIHQFHGSVFVEHYKYAPGDEPLWLRLPEGLFDGAPCHFLWR